MCLVNNNIFRNIIYFFKNTLDKNKGGSGDPAAASGGRIDF